ncbi:hypothetical protein C0J52_11548 [Blattella germanica]|nr:hypothetical protein C0J52_11548 [Blattella germanica]
MKLRWFGHERRLREDKLPKKMYEWQTMGRRKRGRPNITLADRTLEYFSGDLVHGLAPIEGELSVARSYSLPLTPSLSCSLRVTKNQRCSRTNASLRN